MEISRIDISGLVDSCRASKYPKSVDLNSLTSTMTDTMKSLGTCEIGTGHDNFLNGIIAQFDVTASLKWWTEAERYHFFDFVSSQSTMHCITKFDIKKQCNEYVTLTSIKQAEELVKRYNENPNEDNFLRLIYNIPTGFQLTARMTTNYRQLKTMYHQRKNHRLPEWHVFCDTIKDFPMFKNLVLGE